jgi:hypothetical protein
VINHFLWDSLSSEEPNSFNFKVWFNTEHTVHGKGVFPEMVNSLEETIQMVCELIFNGTLTFIFVIVEEIDGISFFIIVFEEEFHSFTCFIFTVNEESFEVIKIKSGFWENIEWVSFFLCWCFFISIFFFGNNFSSCFLFFLWWELWFNSFLG